MPDALSKTVPIWIAVINRFFFPSNEEAGKLQTPGTVVPPSEHSQIESRLTGFVEQLRVRASSYQVKPPSRPSVAYKLRTSDWISTMCEAG